ncbi:hypothetical protein Tco_0728799 [Tanacetum coccineum]|uniref:Uncharacterized protein n=1 Tax=Tanacetum coccineum TaxID=301880 RepID=A0ABQ4YQA7_9ASTR
MVYQLTKFHVQRVDMVINPPWNLPFLGAKGLTSPEQTATGKGISNPLMAVMVCQKPYGIQLTNVSSTERVNTPGSDENRLKLYDLMYKIVNIKNNLKNSIYNILRKLKVFKVKIKNVLKELEVHKLLKELTTSRSPEKVLYREEAKSPLTKSVNSISLIKEEEEKSDKYDVATDDGSKKTNGPNMEVSVKEAEIKNGAENRAKKKLIKKAKKEEVVEVPSSQPVEYYLKHRINEKLIEGLVDNNRSGKSKISFHRIPESLCRIERGVKNDIEHIATTMTINRLVLELEEMIKLHLEREMEFDQ